MFVSANVILAILVLLTVYLFGKNARYFYLLKKVPTNKTIPILGNAHDFMFIKRDVANTFIKILDPIFHKSLVCLWIFHQPLLYITRADAAETILSSNHLITKASMYKMIHPWLGTGLLTSTGNKWHSRRKLITPSFHFNILENFLPVFNEKSEILIKKLMATSENTELDIYPFINLCTLDIICDTAMGSCINAQLDTDSQYVRAIASLSDVIIKRTFKVWLQNEFIFKLSSFGREQERCLKILHGFTDKVIAERTKIYKENKNGGEKEKQAETEVESSYAYGQKRRMVFLDTLLEASNEGAKLTPREIREEVDTFMFEGHDTTTSGICMTIHAMGWVPSIQDKVHEELDRVFGDSTRPVTKEDLSELKYLEGVIKESMRFSPPVHTFGRHLLEDTKIAGYTIPKGADIFFCPFAIHTDPEIYKDPFTFDPTRFFHEDWQKRHPYGYIPFSAGPRNCIGQKFALMEEKIVLAHFFRNFRVRVAKPFEDLNVGADIVFKPREGIPVYLERRQCASSFVS